MQVQLGDWSLAGVPGQSQSPMLLDYILQPGILLVLPAKQTCIYAFRPDTETPVLCVMMHAAKESPCTTVRSNATKLQHGLTLSYQTDAAAAAVTHACPCHRHTSLHGIGVQSDCPVSAVG